MRNHTFDYVTDATIVGMEDRGPQSILLKYEDRIVIGVSYADTLPEGAMLLGELDMNGAGLAIIPLSGVSDFRTWDEAESIQRCMEADQQLLSYAY